MELGGGGCGGVGWGGVWDAREGGDKCWGAAAWRRGGGGARFIAQT